MTQLEAIAQFLHLVLADCEDGGITDKDRRGHAAGILRQKAGVIANRSNNDKVTRALGILKESGSIEYDRNRIVLLVPVSDDIRRRKDEITHDLAGIQFLHLQQEVSFEELLKWVTSGFDTIVTEVVDKGKSIPDSISLYHLDPYTVLKQTDIPKELIGTVINYLSQLGLVYASPHHGHRTWVVRVERTVKPGGLARRYQAAIQ